MTPNASQTSDLFTFQSEGEIFAFHARNLESALISDEAYQSLLDQSPMSELKAWNQEIRQQGTPSAFSIPMKSITINVTQVCNLHCTYCAAGGDGTYGDPQRQISVEKTLPQIRMMMESMSEDSQFSINFLGGEPLLYPKAIEIISEYAKALAAEKQLTLLLSVTTNGTLLSEEIIALLTKNNFKVTVSMDGAPAINDVVRPQKNGRKYSLELEANLRTLLSHKSELRGVRVASVISQKNTQAHEAFEYFVGLGVNSVSFEFDVMEKNQHSSDAFVESMEKLAAWAMKNGGESTLRKLDFFDKLFARMDEFSPAFNYCGAGKSFFMIDAQNRYFACPWHVNDKNKALGQGLELDSAKTTIYQKNHVDKSDCQKCWARHLCGGGCSFIHSKAPNSAGSWTGLNHLFCERTRSLIALGIMYYTKLRTL